MNTNEIAVSDRYYSRFGINAPASALDAVPAHLWRNLSKARAHQDQQDAFDSILDFITNWSFPASPHKL